MARRTYRDIRYLGGASVENLRLFNSSSFPSSPYTGQSFFRTTDATFWGYDGAKWIPFNQKQAVATLSELRAYTSTNVAANPLVYLNERGKEGQFYYDSTDTTSTDNTGTIIVTSSGARYKRIYTDGIQAQWFEISGDTQTRQSIERAVNLAIANLATRESQTVLIKSGQNICDNAYIATPVPTGKKLIIKGLEGNVIDFYYPECTDRGAVFGNATTWTYTENTYTHGTIVLDGLNFNGYRNPVTTYLSMNYGTRPILYRNMQRVEIRNCTFKNIYGSGLAVGVTKSGVIENNVFEAVFARQGVDAFGIGDATGDAITLFAFDKDFLVSNNYMSLVSGQYGRCGISFDDRCFRVSVKDNFVRGYERGIHGETSLQCTISNNHVVESPIAIISGKNKNCNISGNLVDGSNVVYNSTLGGNGLFFAYLDESCTYSNNRIINWVGDAQNIYLAKFWGDNLTITDNTFGEGRTEHNSVRSNTSRTITNTGSMTFNYDTTLYSEDSVAGKNSRIRWRIGQKVRVYSIASGYYMHGTISSYNTTSVTISLTSSWGSGTFDNWQVSNVEQGIVWASGYQTNNTFQGNTFNRVVFSVEDTTNNVVQGNTFYDSHFVAARTVDLVHTQNKHLPFAGENHTKSNINVYQSTRPYVEGNYFLNPTDYVIENGLSVRGVFTDNTYKRTYSGAAGNGYFYVASTLANDNMNQAIKPNIIRDNVNNQVYFVGNTGVAYLPIFTGTGIEVINTTAQTDSVSISIPANKINVYKPLKLKFFGRYNGLATLYARLVLGSTLLAETSDLMQGEDSSFSGSALLIAPNNTSILGGFEITTNISLGQYVGFRMVKAIPSTTVSNLSTNTQNLKIVFWFDVADPDVWIQIDSWIVE